MAQVRKLRPQQYHLEYPLNATQVEHLDTMLQTLFRQVATLTTIVQNFTGSSSGATTILQLMSGGDESGGGSSGSTSDLDMAIPGPAGPRGVTGLPGIPGLDGDDGADGVFIFV